MKFARALHRELSSADQGNWRERLDALHGEHGSWQNVADHLGVHKRTVERWRLGYVDSKTHQKRHIGEKAVKHDVLPKLRKALGKSRSAQLKGVDWTGLSVKGHLSIGAGEYEREENMSLGRYLDPEDIEAIGQA